MWTSLSESKSDAGEDLEVVGSVHKTDRCARIQHHIRCHLKRHACARISLPPFLRTRGSDADKLEIRSEFFRPLHAQARRIDEVHPVAVAHVVMDDVELSHHGEFHLLPK